MGIHEQTIFILTSDHGMTSWKRSFVDGLAATPALGKNVEIVRPGRAPSPDTEVVLVKSAGLITDLTMRGRSATPGRRTDVRRVLEGLTQVSHVLDAADLKTMRAGGKLGDFVVEARSPWGFAFDEPEEGASRGGHGSTREMRVPLLISGSGVRPGSAPEDASLVDVAPTIAALLGVGPPADAEGRVLDELLYA